MWPHTGGESARQLARDIDAVLAGNRSSHEGLTLSPASLMDVDADTRVILPSPNGSSIAFAAVNGGVPVVAALPAQRVGGEPLPATASTGSRWCRPASSGATGRCARRTRTWSAPAPWSIGSPAATPGCG